MSKSRTVTSPQIFALLIVLAALFAFAPQAHADYSYKFQFGPLTYDGHHYDPGEFSFTSPTIIGPWPVYNDWRLTLPYSLELNGWVFNTVETGSSFYDNGQLVGFDFSGSPKGDSLLAYSVVDFIARITFLPGTYGPGVYQSNYFGREINVANGTSIQDAKCLLTITRLDPVPIPAPATILLLGSGLLPLAAWRRFRKG